MSRARLVGAISLRASRNEPRVLVRVPRPLLDALTSSASSNMRSRNSEILVRLARSLDEEVSPGPTPADR